MRLAILSIAALFLLNAASCRSRAPAPENGSGEDVPEAASAGATPAEGEPRQATATQNDAAPVAEDTSAAQDTAAGKESHQQTKPRLPDELLRQVNEWRFQPAPEERTRIGDALAHLAGRSDAPDWGGLVELARWSMQGEPGRYLLLGDRLGATGGRDMDGTPHGMAWYAIEFAQDTATISEPWDVGVCILCFGVAMDDEDLDGDGKPDLVFCTWTIPSEDEEAEVPPSKPTAIGWREGAWKKLDAPPGACKDFVPTAP